MDLEVALHCDFQDIANVHMYGYAYDVVYSAFNVN